MLLVAPRRSTSILAAVAPSAQITAIGNRFMKITVPLAARRESRCAVAAGRQSSSAGVKNNNGLYRRFKLINWFALENVRLRLRTVGQMALSAPQFVQYRVQRNERTGLGQPRQWRLHIPQPAAVPV
jgi:hypothetical protein